MQLHTTLGILDQQSTQPSFASAAKSRSPSNTADKTGAFSNVIEAATTPAGSATFEEAEKASGIKKYELEIAAAAGLLRTVSPDSQTSAGKKSEPSFEELSRTIEDLKKPNQSHAIDMFK
jgi:hypothetical protein